MQLLEKLSYLEVFLWAKGETSLLATSFPGSYPTPRRREPWEWVWVGQVREKQGLQKGYLFC